MKPEELSYNARALAQAHPLTHLARRYVDKAVGEQRTSQPVPEIGIWAGAALTVGYSLRRVEENEAGLTLEATDTVPELEKLDEEATRIAAELRTDDSGGHMLGDEESVIAALDRIIGSEVDRRLDHWRESIDDKAWEELEEYITWWVVKGYALRVAETATGALS